VKKIITIVVIIGAVAFVYFMRDDSPQEETGTPVASENGTFRPNPSNATFIFDDGPITLSQGHNERAITPSSALLEETTLMDKFAYGDINLDGKEDAALFLARYGGGSGTFIYVAVFVSGPVTHRGSEAIFIGDRIAPQSISINREVVTVEYLDRGPDEALASEPTIRTTKQFVYQDGKFQER